MVLVSCETGNEKIINSHNNNNNFIEANAILDSINALNNNDLIKINTRGCVHNCWPRETTEKLMNYFSKLNNLGYFTSWDSTSKQYFLEDSIPKFN